MSSLSQRLAVFLACIASAAVFAQTSAPKTVHHDELTVIGVEARTSGERELSGEGEIPALWERFRREHVFEKIPNKADSNIYLLYKDYSRDRMGEYTVIIGAKVKDKPQVPAGMVLKIVPAGQYAVVTSEKGPANTVIPSAWQKVWALEDKDLLGGTRAYKVDFELYDANATDPQNLQADIYVGLK